MPQFNATRKVEVTATLNEQVVPVSQITLSHEIGMLPTVSIVPNLDGGSDPRRTVQLDLERVGRLTGLLQNRYCNHFALRPDLRVQVLSGDESLDFPCFSGRPALGLQSGGLNLGITGVHAMAVLNLLNPSIYPDLQYYAKSADVVPEEIKRSNSLAERLLLILQQRMAEYAGANQFKSKPVHALNQQALNEGVLEFLNRSFDSTRIIGLNNSHFDDSAVNQLMLNWLAGTPNFLGVLGRMQPAFFLQLNASWDGSAWLETMRHLEPEGDRFIQAPVGEFQFNLAPQFEPPVVQVLVTGPGSRYYLTLGNNTSLMDGVAPGENADAEMQQRINQIQAYAAGLTPNHLANDFSAFNSLVSIARYPAGVPANAVGRYVTVNAPDWLYGLDFTKGRDSANLVPIKPLAAEQDFRNADSRLISAAQHENNQCLINATCGRVTEGMLDWLARETFESLYLASAQARVTLPLTLAPQVGRTYRMLAADGSLLFTGFLANLNHQVTVGGNGQEGQATTTLGFSHVRAPGHVINPGVASATLSGTNGKAPVQLTHAGRQVFGQLAS